MKALQTESANGVDDSLDAMLNKIEKDLPQFTGVAKVAPPHNFRINGQLIPRESHRYSGRTAMQANLDVSEPKPLQDSDSPLTFTMEGYPGIPPSPVIPFFWAPGWNSIQSVNKYQNEVGASLRGGDPGIRLFNEKAGQAPTFFKEMPEPFKQREKKWLLLPQQHVFGSEELSLYSPGIKELSPEPYIIISKKDAEQLGVVNGSLVSISEDATSGSLPVRLQNDLASGIVLVYTGTGLGAMRWGAWVGITKQ
jgi:NADH-quinone oxidoreductase subunit G